MNPDKLNRDCRLTLLSDPVIMSRLHYCVWAMPEKYASWVNHYQQLTLNPSALKQCEPNIEEEADYAEPTAQIDMALPVHPDVALTGNPHCTLAIQR